MFITYIKTALRNLIRNPLVSFINIFGLGLSMSVGLMILIRLQDDLGFDRFHPHRERTYRITSEYTKKNGEHWKMASSPLPLQAVLSGDTNTVEEVVNVYPALNGNAKAGAKALNLRAAFTEPSFFKVFGFTLAAGDPATALQMPNTLVISHSTAQKFFGETNPLGKVINMEHGNNFLVTGVLKENPGKSHIDFDAYASYASVTGMEKNLTLSAQTTNWYAFNAAYTYVLLKKGVRAAYLTPFLRSVADDLNRGNKEGHTAFNMQALARITPADGSLDNEMSGAPWSKILFEIGVALMILLAACFNYTNLTIARSLTRAKEVGLRKIMGARRYHVFIQYIVESTLLAFVALAFAWVLLSFIVEYAPFNDGYEFIPSSFRYNLPFIFASLGFAAFTGLLAGVAPAWILSAFKPLRVLKNLSTARILGRVSIQKTLIVFQYSLSLLMIIFLFAFYRQFAFLASVDPGFKRDNIVVVPLAGIDPTIASARLRRLSGVTSVAAMSSRLDQRFNGMYLSSHLDNTGNSIKMKYYYADDHFIPSLKFQWLAGTNFPAHSSDPGEKYIILNEQAVLALGFKDYNKAIGQKLWIDDSTRLEITGILKDFNYESAGLPIAPLAFRNKTGVCNYLYITTDNSNKEALTARIANAWKGMSGAPSFDYTWLDEAMEKGYSQRATISLLGYLAFMAVAIATLGLLGLVTYTVEVRRKEISIRKVIGADKRQLILLLSKGFIRLLFIAGLIATPIGYVAGHLFSQNFAQRPAYGPSQAIACFLFLLSIGLFTIISQTGKAAMENPVKSLRTE